MKEKVTTISEAISVLIQAAEMAQTKGVYTLKDSAIIYDAIGFLSNPQIQVQETGSNEPPLNIPIQGELFKEEDFLEIEDKK